MRGRSIQYSVPDLVHSIPSTILTVAVSRRREGLLELLESMAWPLVEFACLLNRHEEDGREYRRLCGFTFTTLTHEPGPFSITGPTARFFALHASSASGSVGTLFITARPPESRRFCRTSAIIATIARPMVFSLTAVVAPHCVCLW